MSIGGLITPVILMVSCGSSAPADTSLSITAKTNFVELSIEDVTTNLNSVTTLSKIFEGITENNINNMTATLIGEPGSGTTHTITLKAKDGFVFEDGGKEIGSNKFSLINTTKTLNITSKNTIIEEIILSEVTSNNLSSETTLSKIFDGIDVNNINNMTIKLNGPTPSSATEHTITLTANEGYKFLNNSISITSKTFKISTILSISAISITEMIYNLDVANGIEISTLEKLFSGINNSNFENVAAKLEDGVEANTKKITLDSKIGYVFDEAGTKTLSSNDFKLTLGITPKSFSEINDVIYSPEVENSISITTLKKLFTFTDDSEFNNVTPTIENGLTINEKKITLSANTGYLFDNGTDILNSEDFKITIDINAKDILEIGKIYQADIDGIEGEISLNTLKKLFNIINENDFNNVTSKVENGIDTPNTKKITLSASDGYIFEGNFAALESQEFSITLDISAKLAEEIEKIYHPEVEGVISLETLKKAFNIPNDLDFNNVTSRKEDVPLGGSTTLNKFVLSASDGYIFENQTKTLESDMFALFSNDKILQIRAKTIADKPGSIDQSELTDTISIETLKKVFISTNEEDFHNITSTVVDGSTNVDGKTMKKIVLTANAGFVFANGTKNLESMEFTPSITALQINISRKAEITDVPTATNILMENIQTLDTLLKVFDFDKDNEIIVKRILDPKALTVGVHTDNKGTSINLKAKPGYVIISNGIPIPEDSKLESEIFPTPTKI